MEKEIYEQESSVLGSSDNEGIVISKTNYQNFIDSDDSSAGMVMVGINHQSVCIPGNTALTVQGGPPR